MAPSKKEESTENILMRARVKRDDVLNSIKGIHATALKARADANILLPALIIHAEDLNWFVEQFQIQRDVIINSLIDFDRVAEFEQVDRPLSTSMESMRLEIETIVASVTPSSISEFKLSSSSSTAPTSQQGVPLPRIQLPRPSTVVCWSGDRFVIFTYLSCTITPALATRSVFIIYCRV